MGPFRSTNLHKAHGVISSLVLHYGMGTYLSSLFGSHEKCLTKQGNQTGASQVPGQHFSCWALFPWRLFTRGLFTVVYERVFQGTKHISVPLWMLILQDSLSLWRFLSYIHSFPLSFFCETVAGMTEIFLSCTSFQDTNWKLNNLVEHGPLNRIMDLFPKLKVLAWIS